MQRRCSKFINTSVKVDSMRKTGQEFAFVLNLVGPLLGVGGLGFLFLGNWKRAILTLAMIPSLIIVWGAGAWAWDSGRGEIATMLFMFLIGGVAAFIGWWIVGCIIIVVKLHRSHEKGWITFISSSILFSISILLPLLGSFISWKVIDDDWIPQMYLIPVSLTAVMLGVAFLLRMGRKAFHPNSRNILYIGTVFLPFFGIQGIGYLGLRGLSKWFWAFISGLAITMFILWNFFQWEKIGGVYIANSWLSWTFHIAVYVYLLLWSWCIAANFTHTVSDRRNGNIANETLIP